MSIMSLASASARTGRAGSPSGTVAPGLGSTGKLRRFVSRHVPSAAEDVVRSQVLTNEMVMRFEGLMKHLPGNSDWDEQSKQVMVTNMEYLISEEYDEALRCEFERRCAFGERTNTELMNSAKWVRLLREIGAIVTPDAAAQGLACAGAGAIDLAEADIIFRKVLADCDYGGRRLTYELFCKALYLVARSARPDLDSEAAFAELLARIAALGPEEQRSPEAVQDHMLDANVLLVLDHFKPALFDLFRTFCARQLSNPADACHGPGTVRIRERTCYRHTQETMAGMTGLATNITASTLRHMGGRGGGARSPSQASTQLPSSSGTGGCEEAHRSAGPAAVPSTLGNGAAAATAPEATAHELGSVDKAEVDGEDMPRSPWGSHPPTPLVAGGSDAEGLGEQRARPPEAGGGPQNPPADPEDLEDADYPEVQFGGTRAGGQGSVSPLAPSSNGLTGGNTLCSTAGLLLSHDSCVYANGAPVIKNRRHFMSIEQLMNLCKELKITPDLLTRLEIVQIFKRAQCAGSSSSYGSSLYSFLSKEAFVDAAGQLAIEAYSKPPFSDQYPAAHEKIHAFFLSVLPSSSREVHERFLYGCSGRGR